jgi:hypothetical protein
MPPPEIVNTATVAPEAAVKNQCGDSRRTVHHAVIQKAQVKLLEPRRARRRAVIRFDPFFVIFVFFVVR